MRSLCKLKVQVFVHGNLECIGLLRVESSSFYRSRPCTKDEFLYAHGVMPRYEPVE